MEWGAQLPSSEFYAGWDEERGSCFFYHSNAEPPGVAGMCRVSKEAYLEAKPDWMMVDVEFVQKFDRFVSLKELKANKKLQGMLVIKRGMRLSVQPVDKAHFEEVLSLGKQH